MKRLLLSLLFLSLPAMAAPKYVIQWRDQFGNYRNYQTQQAAAVLEMRQRGDGYGTIAAAMGMTASMVRRILQQQEAVA